MLKQLLFLYTMNSTEGAKQSKNTYGAKFYWNERKKTEKKLRAIIFIKKNDYVEKMNLGR